MANLLAHNLTTPRTDTSVNASGEPEAFVAIPATATTTPAPDGNTPYISTQNSETVRTFVKYAGTVTSATLRMWILQDGDWYQAADAALDPANGNEAYDWDLVGRHTNIAYQVTEITGGGTMQVAVLGVW